MGRQVVNGHGAAEALAQQHQGLALDLRGVVQPIHGRLDVLVNRRQARLALGEAIAAIVDHQHLVALLWKPIAAAQMPGQVAAIAMQVQYRALDLDPGLTGIHQP